MWSCVLGGYTVEGFTLRLYIEKLYIVKLYIVKLYIEKLYIEKLYIVKLYIVKLRSLKLKSLKIEIFCFGKIYIVKELSLCHKFSFVKPISLQPYDVNLWYFKLTLFDLIAFIVWNIKGLQDWVATTLKLENQSLWQKLNSFVKWKFVR